MKPNKRQEILDAENVKKKWGGTFCLKGIMSKEDAKKITTLVKSSKMKVQASINGDEVRITGKKRDDLQSMMTLLDQSDLKIPLQYQNFRD